MLEVSVEPICIGWQAYTANQPRRLAANRKNWLILVGEVLRYFRVNKKISPACSAAGRSASASVHGARKRMPHFISRSHLRSCQPNRCIRAIIAQNGRPT